MKEESCEVKSELDEELDHLIERGAQTAPLKVTAKAVFPRRLSTENSLHLFIDEEDDDDDSDLPELQFGSLGSTWTSSRPRKRKAPENLREDWPSTPESGRGACLGPGRDEAHCPLQRTQKQVVKIIPQERVQQRQVEQIVDVQKSRKTHRRMLPRDDVNDG